MRISEQERIPPRTLEYFYTKAEDDTLRIWHQARELGLSYTYCTRCPGSLLDKTKQLCVCRIESFECVCAKCFYTERVEQLCKEWLAKKPKPPKKITVKLDVADFASIK